jgi:hypothetical protein
MVCDMLQCHMFQCHMLECSASVAFNAVHVLHMEQANACMVQASGCKVACTDEEHEGSRSLPHANARATLDSSYLELSQYYLLTGRCTYVTQCHFRTNSLLFSPTLSPVPFSLPPRGRLAADA